MSRPWWLSGRRAVALLALLPLAGCAAAQERPLLDAARIATLPAAERDAWLLYLEKIGRAHV